MKTSSDLKTFNYLENGEISFSMFDTIKSTKILDPGVYELSWLGYPESRVLMKQNNDRESVKIHAFPDKDKMDDLFTSFFNTTVVNKMQELGFYHKIGVLLYGREGTGKSTILKYYYHQAIEKHNALVFHINSVGDAVDPCWELIMNIRRVQKNPIVVLFEEIDQQIKHHAEGFLKTALDGNKSIDNCIVMGTTNYIDQIPDALKLRPSRFKYSLNIEGIQCKDDVYTLVSKMLTGLFDEEQMHDFSNDLKGSSLDCIKQFCVDKIMDIQTYTNKPAKKIGFGAN